MAEEETLVIVKPDAVKRGLVGEILSRLQRKSLRIAEMRLMHVDRDLAERLYGEHREKAFFSELVEFITSGDVVVARIAGENAIPVVRGLMGATDPVKAAPGTIRGDFGLVITQNLVHGSDSAESAKRELDLFFA
ncbi:MAG TPA: nucleoside-diphosphate kinase [Actinomycetota bacterium]|nr:nucleoside-diphosphate kinase [Actinomycetota bacterium]